MYGFFQTDLSISDLLFSAFQEYYNARADIFYIATGTAEVLGGDYIHIVGNHSRVSGVLSSRIHRTGRSMRCLKYMICLFLNYWNVCGLCED